MNDERPAGPSGSRWEPTPDDDTTPLAAAAPPSGGSTAEHDALAAEADPPPRRGWRGRLDSARGYRPGRGAVLGTGAAAALLAVGGVGGYAIGANTGEDLTPTNGRFGQGGDGTTYGVPGGDMDGDGGRFGDGDGDGLGRGPRGHHGELGGFPGAPGGQLEGFPGPAPRGRPATGARATATAPPTAPTGPWCHDHPGPPTRRGDPAPGPAPRAPPRPPGAVRRGRPRVHRRAGLGGRAVGDLPVGARGRPLPLRDAGGRAGLARPVDRAGGLGPDARAGADDGAHPRGGARLGPGPAGPAAPAGRLHVLQPDARPRRPDHLGLRRGGSLGACPGRCGTSPGPTPACCSRPPARGAWSMVVVTSIRAARRRLRYESWHLLHLYAYLGAGLALPHQLWTGQEFLASPAATVFWWGLWAHAPRRCSSGGVGLPAWRTAAPRPAGHRGGAARATAPSRSTSPGATCTGCRWRPGSSSTGASSAAPAGRRAHPYSLSAAPDGRSLRITVKDLGDGSAVDGPPAARHAGRWSRDPTAASPRGPAPAARCCCRRRRRRDPAARARRGDGGSGRATATLLVALPRPAPLRARARRAGPGARRARPLAPRAPPPPALLAPPRTGRVEDVSDADALRWWVPDLAEHDVFVCGPTPWAEAVRRSALAAGLPPDQLHEEAFSW